jgi:hypothetical protein
LKTRHSRRIGARLNLVGGLVFASLLALGATASAADAGLKKIEVSARFAAPGLTSASIHVVIEGQRTVSATVKAQFKGKMVVHSLTGALDRDHDGSVSLEHPGGTTVYLVHRRGHALRARVTFAPEGPEGALFPFTRTLRPVRARPAQPPVGRK